MNKCIFEVFQIFKKKYEGHVCGKKAKYPILVDGKEVAYYCKQHALAVKKLLNI